MAFSSPASADTFCSGCNIIPDKWVHASEALCCFQNVNTGAGGGIVLDSVPANSFPAKLGLKAGDKLLKMKLVNSTSLLNPNVERVELRIEYDRDRKIVNQTFSVETPPGGFSEAKRQQQRLDRERRRTFFFKDQKATVAKPNDGKDGVE